MAGPVRNEQGYPIGLYDVMKEWAENRLPTSVAIRLGRFEDFADLIKTTLDHGIELKMNLTHNEERQAERFIKAVRAAVDGA